MGKTSIKIIKKDRLSAIRHLIMVLFTHPYHFPSIMLNHFFFHSISSNDFMKASKLLTSIVPAYTGVQVPGYHFGQNKILKGST